MSPFLLKPAGKDYLWGGERLKKEYNKEIDMAPLAETWECSVHPDGPSVIATGEHKGKTLREILAIHPEYAGTGYKSLEDFPILVKFIDAQRDLSVQVHPDDEYAKKNENQNGKTEMWYVLDAEPGADIIYGFEHKVTESILRKDIEQGLLDKHLHRTSIKKGDSFFIPAGTVHAICAGSMLVEIQENSNVTYRVYDYSRKDKNGEARPLHIDKAMDVLNMLPVDSFEKKQKLVKYSIGYSEELLCRCRYFEAIRANITGKYKLVLDDSSFQVVLCIEGSGTIKQDGCWEMNFQKGDCIFVPAGNTQYRITGTTEIVKVRC